MTTATKSFVPEKLIDNLDKLTPSKADEMPIGIVKLDDRGNVQIYNEYNNDKFVQFKGVNVIGKNYFTEIAPCSNNFIFSGRFFRGVENDQLDAEFDYCFTYKLRPTNVIIRLYRDPKEKSNWIFLKALN